MFTVYINDMRHSTVAYFCANLGIKLLMSPVKSLQLLALNLPQTLLLILSCLINFG